MPGPERPATDGATDRALGVGREPRRPPARHRDGHPLGRRRRLLCGPLPGRRHAPRPRRPALPRASAPASAGSSTRPRSSGSGRASTRGSSPSCRAASRPWTRRPASGATATWSRPWARTRASSPGWRPTSPVRPATLGEGAIAQWSQHGFHVQHLTHYYGNTYIDLYEGDGEAAWRRAERTLAGDPGVAPAEDPAREGRRPPVARPQRRGRGRPGARTPAPCCSPPRAFARQLDRERMAWGQAVAHPHPGGRLLDPRRRGPMQAAPGRSPLQGRGRAPRALRRRRPASARLAPRRRRGPRARRPRGRLDGGPEHQGPGPDGRLSGTGFPTDDRRKDEGRTSSAVGPVLLSLPSSSHRCLDSTRSPT